MGKRKLDVEVRISRRTLWVDSEAYPLAHVTRVRPLEVTPRRGRILVLYAREAGAWLGLGLLGLVVAGCLGRSVPPVAVIAFLVVVVAGLVAVTVRVIRRLSRAKLYVLLMTTAGNDRAAVASHDRAKMFDLARRVVEAIDDPAMEYSIHIEHLGDNVFGDKHGGDYNLGSEFHPSR